MRVNSINIAGMRNMSFGKVVKINTKSALLSVYDSKIDPKTRSVIDIIEGKKTFAAGGGAELLGTFLRGEIGDYSKKEGLVAEKICGDVYIFTGKEAVSARAVVDKASKDRNYPYGGTLMVKDFELLNIVDEAKYAGVYNEISAGFDDNGKLNNVEYQIPTKCFKC